MRSLHLDSGREMRGGQWQVLRLLRGLGARGYQVLLLARAESPLMRAAMDEGIAVETLTLASMRRAAREADLIHAHDAHSHSFGCFVSKPLIVSRRVAFPVKKTWLSRAKYGRVARYAAVSRYVASLLTAAGVPEQRIDVVYDGVPLLPISDASAVRVLVPATDDPRKHTEIACEAVRRASLPLVLTDNLERDLSDAAAMVYLSEAEGLGSGVLLAMSAGVPVLATNLPAISEIIEHGVNGMLVSNSIEAVVTALRRVIDDPATRRRMSGAARRTVAERFTEDQMVDATIATYRKALDGLPGA
jgi:glycosyltransferase involved in cell wall biosynthesis